MCIDGACRSTSEAANAFNNCDRVRLLRELYALRELQSLYRIAHFAYAQPSVLVLAGCDGLMIESVQGVRQGDPLSALLFCVYMRDILRRVSEQTGVRVYGFSDDLNLLGTPQQLMAALTHLQHSLPQASLQLNTAKSHMTYFHGHLTPLTATVLDRLSTNNIQLHHDWVGVVGAVVGEDDAAIRAGIAQYTDGCGQLRYVLPPSAARRHAGTDAVLLLRACMAPAMNYYLRCIAPICLEGEARLFDKRLIETMMSKLGLEESERSERITTLLQRKLRDGGWGLAAATQTSPAAFLGSLAACHTDRRAHVSYGRPVALADVPQADQRRAPPPP